MRKLLIRAELCPFNSTIREFESLKIKRHWVSAIALLILLTVATAKAQEPMNIGMTVPDVQLDSMVNYSKPSAHLSDFKGKLVVLDFFATWCSSCRTHLPAMDSLQRKYKESLQIIMVSSWNTKDYVQRVQKMVDMYNKTHVLPLSIPASVKDSALLALLPHKYIPHYVWLDGNLTIKAITGDEFIKESIVEAMLKEQQNIHP